MKKLFILMLCILTFACTEWIADDPETGQPALPPEVIEVSVNTVGFSAGLIAGKMHPAVDTTLRQVYAVFVEGKLELDELNQLLNEMLLDEDIAVRAFANRLIKALEVIGAVMINGQITDIEGIDPGLAQELADGYVEGFDLTKDTRGW